MKKGLIILLLALKKVSIILSLAIALYVGYRISKKAHNYGFAVYDILMLLEVYTFGVSIFFAAIACLIIATKPEVNIPKNSQITKDVCACIRDNMMTWEMSFVIWFICSKGFIAMGLSASIILIYIATFSSPDMPRIILYSIFTLIASLMQLILNPERISLRFRIAFVKGKDAIYKYNSQVINDDEFLQKANECEESISKGLF
jgi:hypothetical protein